MGLPEVQHPMAGGAASPGTACALTLSPDSSLFPAARANSDGPVGFAREARGHDGLHASDGKAGRRKRRAGGGVAAGRRRKRRRRRRRWEGAAAGEGGRSEGRGAGARVRCRFLYLTRCDVFSTHLVRCAPTHGAVRWFFSLAWYRALDASVVPSTS